MSDDHKSKASVMNTYDSIAKHFDVTRYKPWPETIKFSEILEPGSRVLDLGCGNGRNLRHLISKGMKVMGMDISAGQLDVAIGRAKKEIAGDGSEYGFATGDVEHVPVKDDSMDAVLYIATLHHLTSPDARLSSMNEIWRVLKPGGMCLVSAWAREQDKFKDELDEGQHDIGEDWEEGDMLLPWTLKSDEDVKNGRKFMRYYHLYSESEFDDMLEATAFKVLDRYIACDNHYAILQKLGLPNPK